MRAKNVMTSPCISVSPDAAVTEIAAMLIKHHISGVPVVDKDHHVLGIVSEGDLIRRVESGTDRKPRSWWLRPFVDSDVLAGEYVKSHARKARDVMTSPAVTVGEETALSDIASLLESKHIKRVPVVRDGKLVGIVSRANLVQCLAAAKDRPLELPAPSDQEIRRRLFAALESQSWATTGMTNVTVSKGVVELWGIVGSEKEMQATRVAAEAINGVVQVIDHRAIRAAVPASM
jgi:CBS domain-containing protein